MLFSYVPFGVVVYSARLSRPFEPYNSNVNDPNDPNLKRKMKSDTFISLLHEEYNIWKNRNNNHPNTSVNLVSNQTSGSASKSLATHISDCKQEVCAYCEYGKHPGHWTSVCHRNPLNKCYNCGKPGHCAKDCHSKRKVKDKDRDKGKGKSNGEGKVKNQETNFVNKEITFVINDGLYTFTDGEEAYNFNNQNDCTSEGNDDNLIYYDWLADTATSSHVTCKWSNFISHIPMKDKTVTGVGGKQASTISCRTIELNSTCNGQKYILHLNKVLHVPGQKNNLISLERWDNAGGKYIGGVMGKVSLRPQLCRWTED
jgi:hypothetical protein